MGLAALALAAAPLQAETLADAVASAYDANPDILAQRAQLRVVNERYLQARAGLGVNVTGSYTAQTQHALVDTSDVRGQTFTASTQVETLSVTQPIYTGGRSSAQIQSALANIFVGYQNVRREETRVLNQVVAAYVDVQRDQQIVEISQENVKLLEGQVAETAAKLIVREATLTDRDQGYARLAQAQAQLVTSSARLVSDAANYRALVGHDPGVLAPAPPLPDLGQTVADWSALAEQSSPLLLSAEFQEKSSRAGILAAKAEGRPTVALRGDLNQGPLVSYNQQLRNNNQTLRVIVNVPFFSSGAINSGIREARAQNESDANLFESARRQVRLSVAQDWEQMHSSALAEDLYDKQVQSQTGVYKGTKLEEQYALRSTLDILNAAQELNNARIARATAAHDAYAGKASLLADAGRLDLTTFGLTLPADALAPDIAALDRRDRIPWIGLVDRIDGVGQEKIVSYGPQR